MEKIQFTDPDTGTTHNNEKMQWYWIGTKNM